MNFDVLFFKTNLIALIYDMCVDCFIYETIPYGRVIKKEIYFNTFGSD